MKDVDRTECIHGHPWTEENVGTTNRGEDYCRPCTRIAKRKRYAANPDKFREESKLRSRDNHPLYSTWNNMKQRCVNPKHPAYCWYGERGISVCDKWRDSFAAFLEDMGERPSDVLSLDRIDNDGNYEPGNCKWSTVKEQAANRRPYVHR